MTSNTTGETSPAYSAAALIAAAVLAAVATAAAILLAQAFGFILAGDEAPIRVKNLSIDLEVLHSSQHWKEEGSDGTKWKISGGTRESEVYEVYIVPSDPASCPGGLKPTGKTVRFTHSDGTWIELKATGHKTRLTASKPLTLSADERSLSYKSISTPETVQIKTITTDTNSICDFSSKDPALSVLMIDQ